MYTPETKLVNKNITAMVKSIFNPSTHINFIQDPEEKYFLLKIKDEKLEKNIILPEWFIKRFFITAEQQIELENKAKLDLEHAIQQALEKQIADQIKEQEKTYGRSTDFR